MDRREGRSGARRGCGGVAKAPPLAPRRRAVFHGRLGYGGPEGLDVVFPGLDEMHYPRDIAYARHAMSIDEYRTGFKRVPWGGSRTIRSAAPGEPPPYEQVWFAGNHADIGGSYPENESRLSDYPLQWIADFIREGLPPDGRVDIDGNGG